MISLSELLKRYFSYQWSSNYWLGVVDLLGCGGDFFVCFGEFSYIFEYVRSAGFGEVLDLACCIVAKHCFWRLLWRVFRIAYVSSASFGDFCVDDRACRCEGLLLETFIESFHLCIGLLYRKAWFWRLCMVFPSLHKVR